MGLFEELRRRNVFRVGIAYGVTAWLLIQISDTVFPRIGLSESAVTLVIALLAIGFVPALIIAWAFELTPDGLKRERDVDRAESITPQTGKKLDRLIILVLTAVITWLLLDKYYLEPREQPQAMVASGDGGSGETPKGAADAKASSGEKSIAVLPFVNMSADKDNEYFSDGIAEELLNVLVRISALDVASRTSSFAYKGKDLPLSRIADELGVDHILEGSVRKAGNRVRITAQLIDAESDRHLWSDSYERELDDIFDIQEEISRHIVDALKVALDVEEAADLARLQRPTDNTEAYELYLQGRYKWRQRLEDNIRTSIELFERAVELDPDFAKAHEALAVAHLVLPSWSDVRYREALPIAVAHAERALALNPELAEARATMSEVAAMELRWGKALEHYESALEFEPKNASVRQWHAELLSDLGYLAKALEELAIAYELDPASPVLNNVYTATAALAGEDELAVRHMHIAMDLGIDFAVFNALPSLQRLGDWETIEKYALPLSRRFPIAELCIQAHRDPSLLPQLREALRARAEESAVMNAYCAVFAGDPELALAALRTEISDDPADIGKFWGKAPAAAKLRTTPEFEQILRDLRLVGLYRERGWPDRCRPVGEEGFECD